MLKFVFAAAMALGVSGAAFAQNDITATLHAPVAEPTEFLAGDTLWQCADKVCAVRTKGPETDSWLECSKFVHTVGKVASYGSLDENKLAKCNATAK